MDPHPEPTGERLRAAPYEVVGRFGAASNATLLVRLLDRDDSPLPAGVGLDDLDPTQLAVYKPERGEAPLWDFPDGTLHRREVAAHVVSEVLGWGLVPATVLRDDGPAGPGALQRFVPHDPNRHYFTLRDEGVPEVLDQLRTLVAFDLVIDNADRKGGHVLLEGDRVRAIDHGVSLHVEPKLRTVAWDFAREPFPQRLRDDVRRLALWLDGEGRRGLAHLLAPEEVDALAARAEAVSALATFPEPTGPRPFPWPLL